MLTSIATIGGAITALIGVGYKIYAYIKSVKAKKHEAESRSLEKQIIEANTDEERARLARLLSDHINK